MHSQLEIISPNKRWYSLALSLFMHLGLIALAIYLISYIPKGLPGEELARGSVVLAVQNENETEYLTEDNLEATEASASSANNAAVAEETATPPPMNLPEIPELDLPGVTAVDSSFDANQLTQVPAKKGKHEYTLSEDDLKTIKADQSYFRNQEPPGPSASISVFGSGLMEGRRFVFVIDRSKSMGTAGLGVIDLAQKQLANAIGELKDNHYFQVIAYNEGVVMIDRSELLRATEENKKLLPEFMKQLISYGATNHEGGLVAAMTFRPDVIVFLNDGGYPRLDGAQLKFIKQMARRRTSIHTLQFGRGPLQENDNFMMRLARENSGSFRYINVNKWRN